MLNKAWLAAAAALLTVSGAAQADPFRNGGFEQGDFQNNRGNDNTQSIDPNTPEATAITGWTVVNGNIAWENQPNPFNIFPTEGIKELDLTGYADNSNYGGVRQVFDTTVGHTYRLRFDVGNSGRYNGAGGASVAAFLNGSSTALIDFNNAGTDPTDPTRSYWLTADTTFNATLGSTTLLLQGTLGNAFIGLDNVRLDDLTGGAVPEPASWATMIAGLGLMGAALRRRRTTAGLTTA